MNSIVAFVQKYYPKKLTLKQQDEVCVLTLQYLFKLINASAYTKGLHTVFGEKHRVIELRRDILQNGYMIKNIKLWYFYVVKNGLLRKQRAEVADKFEISESDIALLRYASRIDFRKLLKGSAGKSNGPKAFTIASFDRAVANSLKRVDTFTKKFVYRKMRFIIQTQGLEASDLEQEVKESAVRAVLLSYPRIMSNQHCDNIVKRTIHNSGINLMDMYSSSKRSKLHRSDDGTFVSKSVPLQFAVMSEDAKDFLSTNISNSEEDLDLKITVRKLVSSFSGKRQRFLKLLMDYDEEFSTWLRENKITKTSNDAYMERCHNIDTYISHCLEFLGMKQDKGDRFIKRLRKKLAA